MKKVFNFYRRYEAYILGTLFICFSLVLVATGVWIITKVLASLTIVLWVLVMMKFADNKRKGK